MFSSLRHQTSLVRTLLNSHHGDVHRFFSHPRPVTTTAADSAKSDLDPTTSSSSASQSSKLVGEGPSTKQSGGQQSDSGRWGGKNAWKLGFLSLSCSAFFGFGFVVALWGKLSFFSYCSLHSRPTREK